MSFVLEERSEILAEEELGKHRVFKFHNSAGAEGLLLATLGLPETIADSVFEVFTLFVQPLCNSSHNSQRI